MKKCAATPLDTLSQLAQHNHRKRCAGASAPPTPKGNDMKNLIIDAITFAAFIATMYGGTIIIWGMAG